MHEEWWPEPPVDMEASVTTCVPDLIWGGGDAGIVTSNM